MVATRQRDQTGPSRFGTARGYGSPLGCVEPCAWSRRWLGLVERMVDEQEFRSAQSEVEAHHRCHSSSTVNRSKRRCQTGLARAYRLLLDIEGHFVPISGHTR